MFESFRREKYCTLHIHAHLREIATPTVQCACECGLSRQHRQELISGAVTIQTNPDEKDLPYVDGESDYADRRSQPGEGSSLRRTESLEGWTNLVLTFTAEMFAPRPLVAAFLPFFPHRSVEDLEIDGKNIEKYASMAAHMLVVCFVWLGRTLGRCWT